MNWSSLFSVKRTGHRNSGNEQYDNRNSFLRDYDRIIFSSAFRRLQNKTQVFPLPRAVFVHNRLTHSLEVASVGRSLGKSVGEKIAALYPNESEYFREFYRYELQHVIAAACLAHDIGNPPFGHSGEDAIRTFFNGLNSSTAGILENALTPNQLRDFKYYEGNSNAFRILTHNYNEPEPGGYKLTFTTLASVVKYPSCSAAGFNKTSNCISTKKSGFFDAERNTFDTIAQTFGIPVLNSQDPVYARHPFVYLTEAADDICYRVIDLEDAHRLHITNLQTFQNLFLPFFEHETDPYSNLDYLHRKIKNINDDNQKVQYIRARWIGLMIEKLSDLYIEHEAALLSGTLNTDLLHCLPPHLCALTEKINRYSVKNIYNYKSVVETEIAGFNVIGGLLEAFTDAVLLPHLPKSKKMLQLVPEQFPLRLKTDSIYPDMLSVLDYIAGMTDLYALDLFRKITGINIPEIR
jgi:dGTPase